MFTSTSAAKHDKQQMQHSKRTHQVCEEQITATLHPHPPKKIHLQFNCFRKMYCTSLPLLKSSLFLFSGSQYHFLSISGTPRQMVFRALPRTSKEPDTWGARRTEDYGISNLSTRAVFHLSVSER